MVLRKILKDEKGNASLIAFVILAATGVLTLGATMIGAMDTRLSGTYRDGVAALFSAEGGAGSAIRELKQDLSWSTGFSDVTLNNGAKYDVTITALSQYEARINSVGRYDQTTREIEVIVNTDSAFSHLINAGENLDLKGIPFADQQGIRANGTIDLELPPFDLGIRPDLNIHSPDPTNNIYIDDVLYVDDEHDAVHPEQIQELDTGAVRLAMQEWEELASAAQTDYYFDDDGQFNSKDVTLSAGDLRNSTYNIDPWGFLSQPAFDCNQIPADSEGKRTIFIDGSVNLDGLALKGDHCTIIATGDITGGGGNFLDSFRSTPGSNFSFIARGDINLDMDTILRNHFTGLMYAEGDVDLTGKITFDGVVTGLGNVTLRGETDWFSDWWRLYIHEYTSAYNVLLDPVDIITWREKHVPMG